MMKRNLTIRKFFSYALIVAFTFFVPQITSADTHSILDSAITSLSNFKEETKRSVVQTVLQTTNSIAQSASAQSASVTSALNSGLEKVYGFAIDKTANVLIPFFVREESVKTPSLIIQNFSTTTPSKQNIPIQSKSTVSTNDSANKPAKSTISSSSVASLQSSSVPSLIRNVSQSSVNDVLVRNILRRLTALESKSVATGPINQYITNTYVGGASYSVPSDTTAQTNAIVNSVVSSAVSTLQQQINSITPSSSGAATNTFAFILATSTTATSSFAGNMSVGGNASVVGSISAVTFYGDGSNLTGISSFSTSSVRSVLSALGSLSYNNSTGAFSVASGYTIPLTASTTEWANSVTSIGSLNSSVSSLNSSVSTLNASATALTLLSNTLSASTSALTNITNILSASTTALTSIANTLTASTSNLSLFWSTPSNRISAGTGLSWSGNTLNNTGVTSIGGLTGTVSTSSLGIVSTQWTTSGSDIYYTAGNVGIGSSTPSARLSVTGSGVGATKSFVVTNSLGTERLTVMDNGFVGINNNNPPEALSVSGKVWATNVQATNQFYSNATTANVPGYVSSFYTNTGIFFPTTNTIAFSNNGTETLRVSATGNVGIATTTPGFALTVAGDINLTGALRTNGSAGTSGMVLQSTGTGTQWVATSSLGITSGSNFGTSSARASLSVSGNLLTYDNTTGVLGFSTTSLSTSDIAEGSNQYFTNVRADTRADLRIGAATTTIQNMIPSSYIRPMISSSATGLAYDNSTGAFSLASGYTIPLTASTTEWANRTASQWTTVGSDIAYATGKVLIGTTTASTFNLDVRGTYGSQIAVGGAGQAGIIFLRRGSDGAAAASLGYTSAGEGGSLSLTSGGGSGAITLNASGGSVSVVAANTAHSVFHSNGNFGVGTSTPIAKLSVTGTSGSTNDLFTIASSSNARFFTINSTGNVGIATTTPGFALTVAGDINLTGALRTNGSAGTSGMVLQSTGTGTQWVATSSLGISGGGGGSGTVNSGTSGQIAFYSSTGTAVSGTSSIFLLNENVGIGTTTPAQKLSVVGNGSFSGTLSTGLLNITGAGTSTINSNIVMSGDIIPSADITYTLGTLDKQWKDVYIGPGSLYINGQKVLQEESQSIVVTADLNQNLIMRTAGTGDIEFNPSGTGLIQLKGNVQLSGGYDISTSNNSAVSFSDGIRPGNLSVTANRIIPVNTNGNLELSATGTGSIYTTTGNVGIATTTPGFALTVAGDINLTGALRTNGSAGTSGMVLQSTGTGTQWVATSSLGISGGTPSQWTTTGSDIFYTTGNVGVGISSPVDRLAVSGNIYATTGTIIGGATATTTGTRTVITPGSITGFSGTESTARFRFGNAGITNGVGGLVFDSTVAGLNGNGGGIGQSVARTISLYTGDGTNLTERLRVDGSGNIGIATTSPTARLAITGTGTTTGRAFAIANSSNADRFIVDDSGNVSMGTSITSLTTGSFTITANGNIGLVPSSGGAVYFYQQGLRMFDGTQGLNRPAVNELGILSNGAEQIRVAATGNIGIGTTTPAQKLSVVGNFRLTGALFDSLNASGTSGMVLQSTGTGTQWVATSSLGIVSGGSTGTVNSGLAGQAAFYGADGTTLSGTSSLFFSGGNIGIGTTTPGAALQITRSNSANEVEYLRFTSSNTSAAGDELSTYWNSGNSLRLAKMSVLNEGSGNAGFRYALRNADGSVHTRLILNGSGFLGIGSTTPLAPLHVTRLNTISGVESELMRYSLPGNSFAGDELSTYWYSQGSAHKLAKMSVINEGSGRAGFRFGTTNDGALTTPNRVAITGDGRLGVGITAPSATLEVVGTASTTALNLPVTTSSSVGVISVAGSRFLHGYTSNSIFAGLNAGNFTTTGSYNTGIGASALGAVTSGHSNVALGPSALAGVTTGTRNIGIGYLAMGSGSGGGNDNLAIGYGSMGASSVTGNYNTVIGNGSAGRVVGSASGNTILGYSAGFALTGGNNVLIGYQAGDNLVGGTNNIIIGYNVDATSTTMTQGLNIGNLIFGTGLDGSGTTLSTGNIGIGTSTPTSKLAIAGGNAAITSTSANVGVSLAYTGSSGREYQILSCFNCGSAGLGGLEVYDSTAAASRAYIQAGVNGWQTPSDMRLKDQVETLSVLDKIDQVRGASYILKDSGVPQIGVIAQEIKAVFPNAVSGEEIEGRYLGVSYNAIASIALQGVKELNDVFKSLRTQVNQIMSWFGNGGERFNVQGMVCVDDVCVTKEQFKQMLINSGSTVYSAPQSVGIQNDTNATASTTSEAGTLSGGTVSENTTETVGDTTGPASTQDATASEVVQPQTAPAEPSTSPVTTTE